jgi:selenocysteine lyase/cysteine desulfurase
MLTCKHAKFTLPPKITYLNCSYVSPILKSSEKAGIRALRLKRNPANILAEDFFMESNTLREEYAKMINATNSKRIVIIPSASYGLANAAANVTLRQDQNIVVAAEQFPSNYYTWHRLCTESGAQLKAVAAPDVFNDRGRLWNERILEAIDKNTKAVAIAQLHWADGTKFDLKAIRKRTREVNALLIIDGSQSVGALPFDIQQIQPDALICAAYKWLLGPYGFGLAYYGEYFDNGKPIEESWMNRKNSEDFTALVNYNSEYQPGALRYEVGEHSNFSHVAMTIKSVQQLNKWGVNNIQAYCKSITQDAVSRLKEKDFWIEDEEFRAHHIIGLRLPKNLDLQNIKEKLIKNKIYVSYRGNAIRISPNVYNDEKDLYKMVRVLTRS